MRRLERQPALLIRPHAAATIDDTFTGKLVEGVLAAFAQDLLRHRVPDGDVKTIIDKALSLLLKDVACTKLAATLQPRSRAGSRTATRHIPAAVKRAVWNRDRGRCVF